MLPLTAALDWLQAHMARRPPETVPLHQAAGRVLAAPVSLATAPAHPTAAIDGIAVTAAATEGASDYAPLPIQGTPVRSGDAMPPGADAVLPPPAYDNGAATAAIARGANVHPTGHDIPGGTILPAGTRLTPLHLALLQTDPLVFAQPRVAAIESPTLQALITATGAIAVSERPDLILLPLPSGEGRGEGLRQSAPLLQAIRLLLHETIPAIILPRHPAAAATLFALLVAPTLRHLAGLPEPQPAQATLTRKITSNLGQLDAIRVRIDDGKATPLGPAEGIGLLAAAAANGLVLVPEGSEGYPAGAMVPIYPL